MMNQQQTQPHKAHRAQAYHHNHNQQMNHHHPVKLSSPETQQENSAQVQRKLFSCCYIYAILILAVYVTVYYLYQQQQQQQSLHGQSGGQPALASVPSEPLSTINSHNQHQISQENPSMDIWKQELEARLMFVEGLVNVLTGELQDTQKRLREREKCDCPISCTFNGTRYADRSSWQNQCDTCTCQSGTISCQPRKCPTLTCDDPVQLPGQCCPVCMRRCKYNNTIIKHEQKFTPQDVNNKECKCQDGRIKCEQAQRKSSAAVAATRSASTKLLQKGFQQQQQQQRQKLIEVNETNSQVILGIKSKADFSQVSAIKETISGSRDRVERTNSKQQFSDAGDKAQWDSSSSSLLLTTSPPIASIIPKLMGLEGS